MSTNVISPDWDAERYRDRRAFLVARGDITMALRDWFLRAGFVEVETSALQTSPGNETHLHGLRTTVTAPDGNRSVRYLHTSPEFAMKKLLAAGEERIVSFARVYRDREVTLLHTPEFTMVEWYRVNECYETAMNDTIALVRAAAAAAGDGTLRWKDSHADPRLEPVHLTVAEAFRRYGSIDIAAIEGDRDGFGKVARAGGVRVAADDDWSDIYSRILVERIEPRLGIGRLTILCDYPVSEAALARTRPDTPSIAERFELYACGVELANGFAELNDADEQRRRFVVAMDRKQEIYGERYPIDEDFLDALSVMPPASGVALGLDRLVMLATGAPSVHHVQWTPWSLPGEAAP